MDYVNKSKVQGSSFEVGAKVTYEGREMTVSQAPDSDGDIKMINLSGVMALAACLPECKTLTSLKYHPPLELPTKCLARAHVQMHAHVHALRSLFCQRPLTPLPVWQRRWLHAADRRAQRLNAN